MPDTRKNGDDNRAKLIALMGKYDLDAATVAAMTFRKPQTVRAWRCGSRKTPGYAVMLVERRTGG